MAVWRWFVFGGLGISAGAAVASLALAQNHAPQAAPNPAPIRATMDQLHAQGGVPRNWKFLMPPGNATEGRKVFVAMECFACHEVRGEQFPDTSKTPRGVGPDLTGMGAHHPAEYFAESVVNPNRARRRLYRPGWPVEDAELRRHDDTGAARRSRGLPDVAHGGRDAASPHERVNEAGRHHDEIGRHEVGRHEDGREVT
jgi:mono/diheme cytochrome c family protein